MSRRRIALLTVAACATVVDDGPVERAGAVGTAAAAVAAAALRSCWRAARVCAELTTRSKFCGRAPGLGETAIALAVGFTMLLAGAAAAIEATMALISLVAGSSGAACSATSSAGSSAGGGARSAGRKDGRKPASAGSAKGAGGGDRRGRRLHLVAQSRAAEAGPKRGDL